MARIDSFTLVRRKNAPRLEQVLIIVQANKDPTVESLSLFRIISSSCVIQIRKVKAQFVSELWSSARYPYENCHFQRAVKEKAQHCMLSFLFLSDRTRIRTWDRQA